MSNGSHSFAINARIQEMKLPPMRDALVLGKNAPIGCVAMRKALELVSPSPYAHIEFDDDVISDVLIRRSIMARLSEADLIAFILRHVKPHMNADEVLDLELHVEIQVEANST